ncbi:MAG: hypothetical protein HY432_00465 [Candidatus Liptonbacteria bacterium]|nr:hypothetical protein [Candidatus Liptonbacteria bacterium]
MVKKFLIIGIALVVVAVFALIVLGAWLGSVITGSSETGPSPYSAVLLSNGDMYFGKLSWFPRAHISGVWVLQKQADQSGQQQFSIAQLEKAFWGPVGELYLNSKEIVWWGSLRKDSQLVQVMQNPQALQQQNSQTSADTFKGPSAQPPSP